jgi:hypothetical protein
MELKVNIQVSVDGVYQSNGGRHPDFDPGMERGGWARPLFDDESLAYVGDYYQRARARRNRLLLPESAPEKDLLKLLLENTARLTNGVVPSTG